MTVPLFHFSQGFLFLVSSLATSDLKLQKNDKWHLSPFLEENHLFLEQEAIHTRNKPISGRTMGYHGLSR